MAEKWERITISPRAKIPHPDGAGREDREFTPPEGHHVFVFIDDQDGRRSNRTYAIETRRSRFFFRLQHLLGVGLVLTRREGSDEPSD